MNKQKTRINPMEMESSVRLFWGLLVLTIAVFSVPLWSYARYTMSKELHSHCLLVPLVTCYLVWLSAKELVLKEDRSFLRASVFLLPSFGIVWALLSGETGSLSINDRHGLWVLAFLLVVVSLVVGIFGWDCLKKLGFPIGFLAFMIPLPDAAAEFLEQLLMTASAHVTYWFFLLVGTEVEKVGQSLILPVIELEVARECSGIRSTWVLFLTAVLGAYLLLRTSWARILVLAVILPLGIFRNALRILVIGQLCMAGGVDMIDHWLHRRGGPLFFGISLIPLFVLVGVLKWAENRRPTGPKKGERG